MSLARRTADDFARDMAERHAPPSRTHDTGDLPSLSIEENIHVEAARDALASLRKTFEFWVAIAHGLKVLRDKADRIGGRFTFDRLREREGLGKGTLNKTRVSRLLAIIDIENYPAVTTWRSTLTQNERFKYASPEAVHRRCPQFARPKTKDEGLSPMQKLKQTIAVLEEENHKLKQDARHTDGDLWRPTDKPADIARVMFEKLGPSKARNTAKAILALCGAKKTAARR
jgi:hypothetical protein